MTESITWVPRLSPAEIDAINALLNRVSETDAVSAISEHTYLHVLAGGGDGGRHALVHDGGDLVGYGFLGDGDEPLGELLVDPAARGRGVGGALLESMLAQAGSGLRIWAHGRLPAAAALAARRGLRPVRLLCRYTRTLAGLPDPALPPGITVRTFSRDDAQAWLELNRVAFEDLPDQGSWTLVDLQERLRQPWFDPAGFLLAFDDRGLAGFHWTKVHGGGGHAHERTGEVYVLAVAPRARGTGLGSALTVVGLRYLQNLGLTRVMLYVDEDNKGAVAMYTRLGFTRADCDVQFAASDAKVPHVSGTLGS